ncbi:MAG: LacI family DNA-binding transcriptional regulator [Fimbriimonadaceae bacterium]|nr:LacI family DNA-binding transcriptional regulator [Fimbriimonadaceae bacterium]
MRVTQQDIARIASVSQATVSRVLAGDEKVEAAIRERVIEAMRAHNYQPDVRARSLRSQRTHLIGLVLNRPSGGLSDDPFFAGLIAEILDFLNGRPYHLCLDMVNSEAGQTFIYDEMLRTRRVDGLILVESEARDHRILRLQMDRFPFVLIGNPMPGNEIHSVDNDNVLAAEIATRHLLDQGYRRVGMLAARPGVTVSDDRLAGYRRALFGRQDDEYVCHADFGSAAAREAARVLLRQPNRPDALVVLDDFMAFGVVGAARELGIRIPNELGLVGFNDSNLCEMIEGGLSSVSLNMSDIVRRACDRLLQIIENRYEGAPRRVVVSSSLVIRGSSVPTEVSA